MFEIINDTDIMVPELNTLNDYINYVVKKLELANCEFNIILIDDERIQNINKAYRHIDRATDVISFALEDNPDIKYDDFRLLGDIYISLDRCFAQAKEYNHSNLRELCFLATHGILHLLGYDHMEKEAETEMFAIQDELLNGFNITR